MLEELTIDGVTYYQSGERMSYDEAVEWADKNGLRLLTRGEWCDFWDNSEAFQKSCKSDNYWTASAVSGSQIEAWLFWSNHGGVYITDSDIPFAIRCVRKGA